MKNEYIENYTNPKFPYQRDFTERLAHTIATEMTINNGIARWGNGSLVPMACAEFAAYLGYPVDLPRQDIALKEDAKKLFERLESAPKRTISDEERFELQAAFGTGKTIVNVLTGERIAI